MGVIGSHGGGLFSGYPPLRGLKWGSPTIFLYEKLLNTHICKVKKKIFLAHFNLPSMKILGTWISEDLSWARNCQEIC